MAALVLVAPQELQGERLHLEISMSGEVPRLVTITREALRSQGDKSVSTTDSYHTRLGAL